MRMIKSVRLPLLYPPDSCQLLGQGRSGHVGVMQPSRILQPDPIDRRQMDCRLARRDELHIDVPEVGFAQCMPALQQGIEAGTEWAEGALWPDVVTDGAQS